MLKRKFEECSKDFAEQIIRRSHKIEQKQSLFEMLKAIFTDFSLPSPAYVMPALFILGIFLNAAVTNEPSMMVDMNDFIEDMYLTL